MRSYRVLARLRITVADREALGYLPDDDHAYVDVCYEPG